MLVCPSPFPPTSCLQYSLRAPSSWAAPSTALADRPLQRKGGGGGHEGQSKRQVEGEGGGRTRKVACPSCLPIPSHTRWEQHAACVAQPHLRYESMNASGLKPASWNSATLRPLFWNKRRASVLSRGGSGGSRSKGKAAVRCHTSRGMSRTIRTGSVQLIISYL